MRVFETCPRDHLESCPNTDTCPADKSNDLSVVTVRSLCQQQLQNLEQITENRCSGSACNVTLVAGDIIGGGGAATSAAALAKEPRRCANKLLT